MGQTFTKSIQALALAQCVLASALRTWPSLVLFALVLVAAVIVTFVDVRDELKQARQDIRAFRRELSRFPDPDELLTKLDGLITREAAEKIVDRINTLTKDAVALRDAITTIQNKESAMKALSRMRE